MCHIITGLGIQNDILKSTVTGDFLRMGRSVRQVVRLCTTEDFFVLWVRLGVLRKCQYEDINLFAFTDYEYSVSVRSHGRRCPVCMSQFHSLCRQIHCHRAQTEMVNNCKS